jgi:hypothetical protein
MPADPRGNIGVEVLFPAWIAVVCVEDIRRDRGTMPGNEKRYGGIAADHGRQILCLRRIEGQVRGLQQMIEEGRY